MSEEQYQPHTIILPTYAPVAIGLTKAIAEDLALRNGYRQFRIELTTMKHLKDMGLVK